MFGRTKDPSPPSPASRLDDIASRVRRDQQRLRRQVDESGVAWNETPETALLGGWPTFSDFLQRERM